MTNWLNIAGSCRTDECGLEHGRLNGVSFVGAPGLTPEAHELFSIRSDRQVYLLRTLTKLNKVQTLVSRIRKHICLTRQRIACAEIKLASIYSAHIKFPAASFQEVSVTIPQYFQF
uniref:Uncharacterized protein n=1 Tax=Opuntia streptacantha TaxID=393608 RepID=A0A7C9EKR2_OPUST